MNKLPPIHPTLALFSAKDLTKAQTLYRLINDLKIVLPILSLVLIALGVYIARRHRRALIGAGLGFAASMLVLGIALLIARTIYLNSVPPACCPPTPPRSSTTRSSGSSRPRCAPCWWSGWW